MLKAALPDNSVLRVERLTLHYPHFRLAADFHVGRTERLGIFAPSGTGKTTLLRAIAGLETGRHVTGSIFFEGVEITEFPPERRRLGMVFQDYALFSQMTALENVAYSLKLQGVGKGERNERALAALKRVRLAARADANVQKLSGGERQRVAFARSLIGKPRLLLLDEPFSALDTGLREHSRRLLLELIAAEPVPLLLVSHDPADLSTLTDRALRYEIRRIDADRDSHQFSD